MGGFLRLWSIALCMALETQAAFALDSLYATTQEQIYEHWASSLEQAFGNLRDLTGARLLESVYNEPAFGKKEITEDVAFELLDQAMKKINKIVKQKSELVHNIKTVAEEAYRTKSSKKPKRCYYRAKAISLVAPILPENGTQNCSEKLFLDLERSALFENKYVSMNNSVAHVPTNVYDLSDTIVNVGNWTQALNPVFIANAEADQTLKWQYFCSSTGFFRYYPGAMWDIQLDEPHLDFFDCRSQPWYLAASSCTKEMIILVDKSGSMKGRNDIISNATVAEILNTLTENDFFNVIMFSDSPKYVDPEINDRLLQAVRQNKDRVIKRFQDFTPNGTASFERAFNEAFNILNSTREPSATTSQCNRMLMIITDSVPGSYKEMFEQLNPDKTVRVFVYLLGQHSSAEPYLEELACHNRGYAVTIATLTDVKENVLKYLDVVARSNVLQNHSYIKWSGVTAQQLNIRELKTDTFTKSFITTFTGRIYIPGIYPFQEYKQISTTIDTLIAAKEEIPPLFTSVAEAVFDKTSKSIRMKKGKLLGVAGTDVPLQCFQDALRGWEIGVNNYLFAVDNNGFILFHPEYRPTHKSVLKNYYQNVDLNEVEISENLTPDSAEDAEGSTHYTPLRQAVISGERKVSTLRTQAVMDNRRVVFRTMRKYFTSPIEGTPFTLVLSIHWNPQTNSGYPIPNYVKSGETGSIKLNVQSMGWFAPVYEENSATCGLNSNHTPEGATLVPYQFCKFDKKLAELYTFNPICALREVLLDDHLQEKLECDRAYLRRIVLEAEKTQKLLEYWREKATNPLISEWGIQQMFSFHHGGLIRYRDFLPLAYPSFIQDHIRGTEDSLYASTVLTTTYFNSEKVMVYHLPPSDLYRHYSSQGIPVPISATTAVLRNPGEVPMAVVGVQITHYKLQAIVNQIWSQCGTRECEHCGNSSVNCYLINQAAIVLYSSGGDKDVGRSLKEINYELMEVLINRSVLLQQDIYDFQSVCIETNHATLNSGARTLRPLQYAVNLVYWLIQEIIMHWLALLEHLNARPIYGQRTWIYTKGAIDDDVDQLQLGREAHNETRQSGPNFNPHYYRINEFGQTFYSKNKYPSSHQPGNTPQLPKERDDENMDINIPPLPPLDVTNQIDNSPEKSDSGTDYQKHTAPPDTEIVDESVDFFGKIEQDSYESQQKALEALERCREEQSVSIQVHMDPEHDANDTDGYDNQEKFNATQVKPLIPGGLLSCVHKSVQQRCHLRSSTSSFTGRYACEVVCSVIRERMPHIAHKLEECRQPLVPCTEKFETFKVNLQSIQFTESTNSWQKNYDQLPKAHSNSRIESDTDCGTRHWWIKRLEGTNLFLLIDRVSTNEQLPSCRKNRIKPYRYGQRVLDSRKTRPKKPRRDPPVPRTCTMIKASMENSSECTNGVKNRRVHLIHTITAVILQWTLWTIQ